MNDSFSLAAPAEILAKSVGIILLAGSFRLVCRRWSAAQRHALWLTVCVALLLLPLTKCAVPRWTVPLKERLLASLKITVTPLVMTPRPRAVASLNNLASAAPWWRSLDLPKTLLIGWMCGTAGLLGYRLLGSILLARLGRRSVPCHDARVKRLARAAAEACGMKRRLHIRESNQVDVPVTWGSWRPVVLLPAALVQEWSDLQLAAALRHELSHVTRHDYATRTLSQIVAAIYWPNPLVWFVVRALQAAQEESCDDLVLQGGTPAPAYATLLLETAQGSHCRTSLESLPAISMARTSRLQRRIAAVVDERRYRHGAGRFAVLLGVGVVGALTSISALAQVATPGSAAVDPTPASKPTPTNDEPMIEVETKFIEVPAGMFPVKLPGARTAVSITLPPGKMSIAPTILTQGELAEFVRALNERKDGVDLLAAPKVTTRSGQKATIEMNGDRALPSGVKPTDESVGTKLEICPEFVGQGTINLVLDLRISALDEERTEPDAQASVVTKTLKTELLTSEGQSVILRSPVGGAKAGELLVIIACKQVTANHPQ